MLAQFTGKEQRNWDDLLPEMRLALNTCVCEATGYSPAFLVQGREPRAPKALYDEQTFGTGHTMTTPEAKATKMREIFEMVRRNQQTASIEQARHYNLRRRKWWPVVGDRVLVKEHHLSKATENFAAKLAPKCAGPYRVMNFVSPVIVELDKVHNGKRRTAHLSELKPFYGDEEADAAESPKIIPRHAPEPNSTQGEE
ncbi:uncharacterized protein LOC118751621 [Rhagoletis pomonella]|uniref:uncharacterized protein LOC118751621 n=1 Tax=Rhagoletis pomonella TaxID=28610 RepID=UPI00177D0C28|nr:uncharacterized protein LOC118751621 [Rhagoletis pomonella]